MKKQLLFALAAAMLSLNVSAQERDPNLIPCATYDAMEEYFKANPAAKASYEATKAQMELEYEAAIAKNNTSAKVAAPVYTVPVVFHIMGNSTLTDQAFVNLVGYINNDYAATGADKSTINSAFLGLYVDAEIRFALAKKDPDGKCTNGIIRHDADSPYWSQTSPNYAYSGNTTGKWPTNKYLNIYIVDCISSSTYTCPTTSGAYIGGYTYLPGTQTTASGRDAIVMLKNQVAINDYRDSRTLSHEIGHWLNLSHTFGSSNNPGTGTCGTTALNDYVADTPETKGFFSTCPSTFTGDCSTLPNVENIMDYSSCPKMFTQGQVTRMRTAITSTTGGRNNLWSTANLLETGIAGSYTCTPVANFEANKVILCSATTVTFTSLAYVGSTGSVNWTFQGGSPATSTATSQVVTYATPGTYSVGMVATNPTGSNTMTKTSYINVVNSVGAPVLPSAFDFEGSTLPSSITVTNGNTGSVTWVQNNSVGATSTSKSIFINNASATSTPAHIDIFETPVYNFSNTSAINFSYYYAYARRTSTQADTFKVQYSLDCGGTWSAVLSTPTTAQMATASGGITTTTFVPTATQWIQKTHATALLNTLNNKPSVKFRFWFKSDVTVGRSNNIYIDQINITGNVVTAITELENSIGLALYPNPTASSATLDFNLVKDQKAKITVFDMTGRSLEEITTSGNDGHVNYTVNQNGHLASGIYIVNIDVNGQKISKKLVIE